ncbi:MAG: triose-phosphate isomerase [Candidatus Lokiarchaeota archaeon]|nr:triose-phosphate isomerase [Candidatus Lokiarchaeota archaeon]
MQTIIGGNWKMQLGIKESIQLAKTLVSSLQDLERVKIYVAPSFVALPEVATIIQNSPIKLAAQNMSEYESGAYTGEISPLWLKELGCEYVILGHSERRRILGESNELINKKVHNALKYGLKPILCIGESASERSSGKVKEVNARQLEKSLKDIDSDQIKNIIIAYEPVWAINSRGLNPTGEIVPATPKQAEEMHNFIQQWLVSAYGNIGKEIPLQYGGSVKPENAKDLLSISSIHGALVGGASLNSTDFVQIIRSI